MLLAAHIAIVFLGGLEELTPAIRRIATEMADHSDVFTQQRSTSATLQACAMQPRGV